jgi:hypothetical protein
MPARPLLLFAACAAAALSAHADEVLRLGLLGLDTSHVTEFTRRFNRPDDPQHVPGARVVAAHKSWSADIPDSAGKVEGYAERLEREFGVALLPTPEAVCAAVDAVLVTAVDGRPHLAQARAAIAARKPFFVDKPAAGSLADAVRLFVEARAAGVPVFTASSLRWYPGVVEVARAEVGEVRSALSIGPSPTEPHHPTLFWYGIHPGEALYTVLGPGCERVSAQRTPRVIAATGVWRDGRVGVLHALPQGPWKYQVTKVGTQGLAVQSQGGDYTPMLREMVAFFRTGQPPVDAKESLELLAFLHAVDVSLAADGAPIPLRRVLEEAGCPPEWLP